MATNILEEFDRWTLSIGDGEMESIKITEDMIATKIIKNSKDNPNSEQEAMSRFVNEIFPNIATNISNPEWLHGRCILATTNKEVDMINEMVQDRLPGTTDKLYSADTL